MSVVTIAEYRTYTGDTVTADATVQAKLDAAIKLVGDTLGRWLPRADYTEALLVHEGPPGAFKVYPSATPITAVETPAGSYIGATGEVVSIDYPSVDMLVEFSDHEQFETVVYTGGYETADCPVALKIACAQIAYAMANGGGVQSTRGALDATSVRLGDAAVTRRPTATGKLAVLDLFVPGISATLKGWERIL